MPPFVTSSMLQQVIFSFGKFNKQPRRLSVVVDVSCDTSNPFNPIPIYKENTSFTAPSLRIMQTNPPVDVISIDHLPSLVPLESSK